MAPALHVLVVLALAWAGLFLLGRAVDRFRAAMQSRIRNADELQRATTLARVFLHTGSAAIVVVAGMLVLQQLGVSIAPLLGAAGVAGIAVGFGAQSLVRDFFSGIFLLVEDQVRQGDVVSVAGREGVVEEVTLRYVRLRDFAGHVHFVPNGEIKIVSNLTRGSAEAVLEVPIGPREDVDFAVARMEDVAREMRHDPAWRDRIAGELAVDGIERWTEGAVLLRARLRVPAVAQWDVRREFLRRLQRRLHAPVPAEAATLRARERPRPAPR